MGKKGLYLFFIITSFLILIPFVSAISEVFVQTQDNAILIEYPKIFVLKQNQDFHVRFHAFNKTSGELLTNETTNCTLNVYASSGEGIIRKENLEFNLTHTANDCQNCFGLHILGGNFSEVGSYSYLIRCNNVGIGGAVSIGFKVTPTGQALETSESLLYVVILIITFILFLGFLYPAIKLPYSNKTNKDGSITGITRAKYLKLLSIWFAYGFFMWFLQTLNGISKSFITLTYLSNFITNIFTYSQGFSLAVTFLILIIMFVEVWKDIIISKAIKRYGKAFIDKELQ